MKGLLILVVFLIGSNAVLACTNPEAQYMGSVVDYNNCTFKIKFTHFKESAICPLVLEDAQETTFTDASCSLKNADQLSGYLVMKDGQVVVD